MRKMKVFFGVLLIALLVPAGLRAQAGATGAITGTVVDQKGFNNFAQRGTVTFSNTPARDASTGVPNPPALSGFQNFLLGRVDTTQAEAGFLAFHFRALDFSGYVQDDWKISRASL